MSDFDILDVAQMADESNPAAMSRVNEGLQVTNPTSGTVANVNAGLDLAAAGLEKSAADAFEELGNSKYAARLNASAETNRIEAERVKADNVFDQVLRSASEYIPTIAATAATGGVGGAAMMGAQSYGGARVAGADKADALAYGALSTGANFLLPGAGKAAIGKVGIKNVPKAMPISNIGNRAIAAGEQALAAGIDSAAYQQATTGEIDPMSVMESAALGGVIGGATAGKADTTSTQATTPTVASQPLGTMKPRTLRGRAEDIMRDTTRDQGMLKRAGEEYTRRNQLADAYEQQFPNRAAPPRPDAADIRTSEDVSGPLGSSREMSAYRTDQAYATAREAQKAREGKEFHEDVVGGDKSVAESRQELSDMLTERVGKTRGERDDMYNNITNDEKMVFNNLGVKEGAKNRISSEVSTQMRDSGYSGFTGIKRAVDEARNMNDLIAVRKRLNKLPDSAPPYEVQQIKQKLDEVIENRKSYNDISNPTVSNMVDKAFDNTIGRMKERSDVFSKEFAPFLKGDVSKMSNKQIADQMIDTLSDPGKTRNKSALMKKLNADEIEKLATINANTINKKINLPKSDVAAREIKEEMDNFSTMIKESMDELDDAIATLRKEGGDIREESAQRMEKQKGEMSEAKKRLEAISGGYELYAGSTAGKLRSIEGTAKTAGEGYVRKAIMAFRSLRDVQALSSEQIAKKADKDVQKLIKDAQKAGANISNMNVNTKPTAANLNKLKENMAQVLFTLKTLSSLPQETESDSKDLPDLSRPSMEKASQNAVQEPEQALPNVRAPGAVVPSAVRARP